MFQYTLIIGLDRTRLLSSKSNLVVLFQNIDNIINSQAYLKFIALIPYLVKGMPSKIGEFLEVPYYDCMYVYIISHTILFKKSISISMFFYNTGLSQETPN